MFLGGINFKEFLSTPEEWHALIEGFCEVLCFWPPRYDMSKERLNELEAEHHYYVTGRALGIIGWLVIAIIIKAVFL